MAFGSFERKSSSQPMAEINMVPLIDVVLVLLVIFIVTAPLLTNVVKLDLPRAEQDAGEAESFAPRGEPRALGGGVGQFRAECVVVDLDDREREIHCDRAQHEPPAGVKWWRFSLPNPPCVW